MDVSIRLLLSDAARGSVLEDLGRQCECDRCSNGMPCPLSDPLSLSCVFHVDCAKKGGFSPKGADGRRF